MQYKFKEYKKSEIRRNHLSMGQTSPTGEKFNLNSLYFEKNEKPWIGVMGEYHFNRDNADNWYEELCKMKAGGINIVSTYLFWIYHEEKEGVFDFSGDLDIGRFVREAKRAGLYVALRLGPWAHGEARNGGFPEWLVNKPYELRDNNTEYLKAVRRYFEHIYIEVKDYLFDRGGNVIIIQFENELTNRADHIKVLKDMALDIGFNAPYYTATGWNSTSGAEIPIYDVTPVFGGYPEAPWEGHTDRLAPSSHYFFNKMRNDSAIGADLIAENNENGWQLPYEMYPFATCELGGGIEITHHRRPIIDPMDIYSLALVTLGSGNNLPGYYMYHGGTNKIGQFTTFEENKSTGYPNDYPTLSYDFQGPLSEYGEIRDQYRLLNLLNLFVADFGEQLSLMEAVESIETVDRNDIKSLRYMMRTDGKSGFVFINHHQRIDLLEDVNDAEIIALDVSFPPIDVTGKIGFFMPFNISMGSGKLKYATAQPICIEGNKYYFAAIPGIEAKYEFYGEKPSDIEIITISFEEAKYLRKLDGKVYITPGYDSYLLENELKQIPDINWMKNNGKNVSSRAFSLDKCSPAFNIKYDYEMTIGGERKLDWYELTLSDKDIYLNADSETLDAKDEFIEIKLICDAAQLYADGELVADEFYYGKPWRIPVSMLENKKCYVVTSEIKDDFYKEF